MQLLFPQLGPFGYAAVFRGQAALSMYPHFLVWHYASKDSHKLTSCYAINSKMQL